MQVQVGDEAGAEHDVQRPIAKHLVRDVHAVRARCISGLGDLHDASLTAVAAQMRRALSRVCCACASGHIDA